MGPCDAGAGGVPWLLSLRLTEGWSPGSCAGVCRSCEGATTDGCCTLYSGSCCPVTEVCLQACSGCHCWDDIRGCGWLSNGGWDGGGWLCCVFERLPSIADGWLWL